MSREWLNGTAVTAPFRRCRGGEGERWFRRLFAVYVW